ncbi:MAG: tyrosine-protein phosphatase [Coriobacteriales bacterium]|nr:tyrosine-protein phosphatase [Coriobacteriales bacterium]
MSEYSMQSQSLGLQSVGNAHDLGGYRTSDGRTIRRGALLRSAVPVFANEDDRARLRDELHVTTVLDFRMQMELDDAMVTGGTAGAVAGATQDRPAPHALEFAHTQHIRILDEEQFMSGLQDPTRGRSQLSPMQLIIAAVNAGFVNDMMYVDFLEADAGKQGYSAMFRALVAQPRDEALLFHCTQGKDRTGLAAMLILDTLGTDEQTILFDYLLTNEFNAPLIERERQGLLSAGIAPDQLDRYMLGMDQVYPQTMHNAMAHLRDTYASVWGYVHDALGVSETEREQLRRKYLE